MAGLGFDSESTKAAEESLIGAILLDSKQVLPKIVDMVTPDDFYFGDYGNTYKAVLELSSEGSPIDYVTVLGKVVGKHNAEESKAKAILLHCCQMAPSISSAESYAKLVAGGRKARVLRDIGAKLFQDTAPTADTAEQIANEVMAELYSLSVPKSQKRLRPIGEIALQYFQKLDKEYDKEDNRVDTGFTKTDSILKGMCAGNLIVLAARPKVGKTAFAMTIGKKVARTGKTVAIFSLEMEDREIYERALSQDSGVEMNTLIDRKFNRDNTPRSESDRALQSIVRATDQFQNLPVLINDNPVRTANDIRLECRMVKNLGLIIVDYLQLMKPTGKCENRNQEIGSITRELKIISAELGVPILLLAQLNRGKSEFDRPTARDLRDSGEIEQNANKVVFMFATEVYKNELGTTIGKSVGVDIALNRRGNTGVVLFDFNGNFMSFTETDKKYEEKPAPSKGGWETRV